MGKIPNNRKAKGDHNTPSDRWDTGTDENLTLEEFPAGQRGNHLETRFKNFDKGNDGKVIRHQYLALSAR
ncbi:MAG: hypothetical protein ACSHYF_00070 [Verrucomicrobiaceae bacterium]